MSIEEVVQYVAWAISAFGLIIIIAASIVAFTRLARVYVDRRVDEPHRRLDIVRNREKYTGRIIFGLDFLIASDIIISVIVPTVEDLLRLAGIVVIRAVLTLIISKETQELERQEEWEEKHEHDDEGGALK